MRALALLLAVVPLPALASGPDCGGDAYSSATIGANPPGPLTAVPDTLCADLEQDRTSGTRIEILAPVVGAPGLGAPGLAPPGIGRSVPDPSPYGHRAAPAPYEGRPLLGPRPRGGRDPER